MVPLCPAVCPLCGPDFPREELAIGPDFEYAVTGEQEFRFVRCQACRCVLLDPRPADSAIASLYPPNYEPYRFDELPRLVRLGRDYVQRAKTAVVRRYAARGATIVDVGCGSGSLLKLLRAHAPEAWRLIGWDYPGPHLSHLSQHGIEIIAGPIDEEHAPREVDLFVLNQVIEHVPRPDLLLRLLARSLTPNGHVLLETPNVDGLDARIFSGRHWGGYHIPRHLVLFDGQNLPTLLAQCGFTVVATERLPSPAFWVQSLHHRLVESQLPRSAALFTLRNLPLVALFTALDLACGRVVATSNQRVIARKTA